MRRSRRDGHGNRGAGRAPRFAARAFAGSEVIVSPAIRTVQRMRSRAGLAAALLLFGGLSWPAIEVRFVSMLHEATLRLSLPGSPRPKGDPNTPDESRTGGAARG